MAFVAIPGAVKVEVLQTWDAIKPVVNVLHFGRNPHSAAPWTFAALQSLADAVFASWNTNWGSIVSHHMVTDGVRATDLTTATGFQATSTGAPVTGSDATESLPSSTACVVTLRTAIRSRSGRGRIFLAGMTTGALDNAGKFTAAFEATADNLVTHLVSDAGITAIAALSVASKKLADYNIVTAHLVRSGIVRSQRRREEDH